MDSNDRLQNIMVEVLLESLPDCQAIYRFGSWGTEAQRPDSDIDIAILPARALEQVQRWELAQAMAVRAGRDVDLVDLLRVSTVLRMQVVAQGELLYAPDTSSIERFEDMVFSNYARLNEERRDILADVRQRGSIYGK